jgi:hypothetical protein
MKSIKIWWIHDQDNVKIVRWNGQDKMVAREKWTDYYKKVADSKCIAAQKILAKKNADVKMFVINKTIFDRKKRFTSEALGWLKPFCLCIYLT